MKSEVISDGHQERHCWGRHWELRQSYILPVSGYHTPWQYSALANPTLLAHCTLYPLYTTISYLSYEEQVMARYVCRQTGPSANIVKAQGGLSLSLSLSLFLIEIKSEFLQTNHDHRQLISKKYS